MKLNEIKSRFGQKNFKMNYYFLILILIILIVHVLLQLLDLYMLLEVFFFFSLSFSSINSKKNFFQKKKGLTFDKKEIEVKRYQITEENETSRRKAMASKSQKKETFKLQNMISRSSIISMIYSPCLRNMIYFVLRTEVLIMDLSICQVSFSFNSFLCYSNFEKLLK